MRYLLFVCLLAACSHGDIKYTMHKDVPGPHIRTGDFLSLHYTHHTMSDSLLSSSYLIGHPVFFEQQKPFFKNDIFTGLSLLSEGDSATFRLNFDSMHIILNVPRPANAGPELVFMVKVEKVIARAGKPDSVFQAEVRQWYASEAEKARLAEPIKLAAFRAMDSTGSGLRYTILRAGNGVIAHPGDSVTFSHTGRYLSGIMFVTSNRDSAIKAGMYDEERVYRPDVVVAGAGSTVPGVDEALLRFPVGTLVRLLLPSNLAYGERGNSMFPPYTPLVFEVEVMGVSDFRSR
ncbi:FKBP-type peptidyl-prolyl cis-trans isomerase [Chitinophaga horti]|uniref:Peptidyl-prolyl cis-trans isomerase n=1 Tax=Chitinophaga horti TaxID=2920382 RepID=A0ABY6J6W8_9BACT|nr:FKBP-type peptidyl-prolyl cis-trans isomerase [Chitinophaga horti]UYQ94342.1 FKBP-type peptidyl-prolyl cis-trans isomerase [Chitinophaga horti]